ncbi:hypothetical protein N9A80_01860, partial [Rhodopirellula sp.]|nr:hypothetical protein [Rhodopirellula sp.]
KSLLFAAQATELPKLNSNRFTLSVDDLRKDKQAIVYRIQLVTSLRMIHLIRYDSISISR